MVPASSPWDATAPWSPAGEDVSEARRRRAGAPRRLAGGLRFAALVLIAAACPLAAEDEDAEAVASIGAERIARAELLSAAAPALERNELERLRCESAAQSGRHEALQAVLREMVRDRLLELESARTGEPRAALQADIESAAQPVGQEQIEAFYLQNQARIPYPLAQVAGQIRALLEEQELQRAEDQFYAGLEQRFDAQYRLGPLRFAVAAGDFAAQGPEDAPVTIVEFSDFQCPFCARLLPTLERAKQEYAGKLRVVYRHFPLDEIHPHAQKAAEAAACAGEQGRFWELHDLMFAEQDTLDVAGLKAKARRLELDGAAFDRCLDSGRHYAAVREDLRAGTAAGVTGTPALFVNGRSLGGGAVAFERLAAVIDEELARAAGSGSAAPPRQP